MKAIKQCVFCSQNIKEINYEDAGFLRRFISNQAKIIDPRHTGVCSKHQRLLARAIKRSRVMGLLPFVQK